MHDEEYPTETFLRQNAGPLNKSPTKELPQDTQQEKSSAKAANYFVSDGYWFEYIVPASTVSEGNQ